VFAWVVLKLGVLRYVRVKDIGKGAHGRVWLCEELDPDSGVPISFCAMKEVYREEQQRNLRKAQRDAANGRLTPAWLGQPNNLSAPVTPTSDQQLRPSLEEHRRTSGSEPYHDNSSFDRPPVLDRYQLEEWHQSEGDDSSELMYQRSGRTSHSSNDDVFVRPSSRPRRSALQMDDKVRQEIAIMKRSV
jgi:hypothetical protein